MSPWNVQWDRFDEDRTLSIATRRGTVYVRVVPGREAAGWAASIWRTVTRTVPIWGTEWVVSVSGPGVRELGFVDAETFPMQGQAFARAEDIERIVRRADRAF